MRPFQQYRNCGNVLRPLGCEEHELYIFLNLEKKNTASVPLILIARLAIFEQYLVIVFDHDINEIHMQNLSFV